MDTPVITSQVVEKVGITAIIAAMCAKNGWFGWLLVIWIMVLALDWISGTAAAMKAGTWSSKVAREGAWHKAGELFVVLLAFSLDVTLWVVTQYAPAIPLNVDYNFLVTPLVLAWYILTEAGSIIENAGNLGAPIPGWLKKLIAMFRSKVDKKGEDVAEEGTAEKEE